MSNICGTNSLESHFTDYLSHIPIVTKSEDDIRHILVQYNRSSRKMPWLSKVPVNELQFCNIRSVHTAAYCLQTMWESRKLTTKEEPSPQPSSVAFRPTGNAALNLDSPVSPWNIKIASQPFVAGKTSVEIPGNSLVVACKKCIGAGIMRCKTCNGRKKVACKKCSGGEMRNPEYRRMCRLCNETGSVDCPSCESGKVICSLCRGLKFLRETKWVDVEWNVVTSTPFVLEDISSNWEEVASGSSKELADAAMNSKDVFYAKDSSPNEWKNGMAKATDLIRWVDSLGRNERQLQLIGQNETKKVICFRQKMKAIPISEINVEYHGEQIQFFILGNENKICWVGGFPDSFPSGECCAIV